MKMITRYGAELSMENNYKRQWPNGNKEAKQEHIYELKWNDNGKEKMKEKETYEKMELRMVAHHLDGEMTLR